MRAPILTGQDWHGVAELFEAGWVMFGLGQGPWIQKTRGAKDHRRVTRQETSVQVHKIMWNHATEGKPGKPAIKSWKNLENRMIHGWSMDDPL